MNTILVIIFMGIISIFKQSWWYNTLLCYPFGMWFSKYKESIEKYLEKNKNFYKVGFITILIFLISYVIKKYMTVYVSALTLSFVSLVILFTMKFKLKDKYHILEFLGNNVFYIYIYQRIPMILLKKVDFIYNNKYIYFIICLLLTFIITIFINNLFKYNNERNIKK